MKSAIAILAAGILALAPQDQEAGVRAQDAQQARIRQLEEQLAKYREATDKLIATLTRTNDQLNDQLKEISGERAQMAIRIAKLEVMSGEKSSRPKRGLVYQGAYKSAVDNLNRSAAAMMRADSVDEARKLLDGALKEIEAARLSIADGRY